MKRKKIDIINSGIYSFKIALLLKFIDQIDNINLNNEYYLTQIFQILFKNNYKTDFTFLTKSDEIFGVNNQEELIELENLII